jgi:BirA family biotin operon repressor/biotin-[acetyl-CoA-carboxylase] ligase
MHFDVTWHDRLTSTNDFLREQLQAHPHLPSGTLVAAREQTAGKGRRGRSWMAGANTDLVFSFWLQTQADAIHVPALSMAVALGVDDLLHAAGITSRLKWPNDLLVCGKKICGILSEDVSGSSPGTRGVIVGMGLNVNMDEDAARCIDQPATSMRIETGRTWDLESVLQDLLACLPGWLLAWEGAGFSGIRDAWTCRYPGIGQALSVREGEGTRSGRLVGFGANGELLLQEPSGETRSVWSAEVRT